MLDAVTQHEVDILGVISAALSVRRALSLDGHVSPLRHADGFVISGGKFSKVVEFVLYRGQHSFLRGSPASPDFPVNVSIDHIDILGARKVCFGITLGGRQVAIRNLQRFGRRRSGKRAPNNGNCMIPRRLELGGVQIGYAHGHFPPGAAIDNVGAPLGHVLAFLYKHVVMLPRHNFVEQAIPFGGR
jgi:hypothetical protein